MPARIHLPPVILLVMVPETTQHAPSKGPGMMPFMLAAGVVIGAVVTLRAMGRVWWCACGRWNPWISDIWSSHCSQHLFDPYTFSHISHGLLFFVAFRFVSRWLPPGARSRFTARWWFFGAILLEAGWEVLENTPMVIERYRSVTVSLSYNGDSVLNSLADIASCAAGFWFAWKFGVWRALALFLIFEVLTLIWIRDNLTLNVIMLVQPIESIRVWQTPESMR